MKIGASSFIWVSPFSGETLFLLQKVRGMGFDAFEICIEDPSTIDPSAIAEAAGAAGIGLLICGAFGPERDIGSEDGARRENGLRYIKTCIDIATAVGSELVAGPMYAGSGNMRQRTEDEARIRRGYIIENMRAAADYAAERGIKLALEPLNRFETDLINTVHQGNEMIDAIGKDNVGFLLDTFHMNIEETDICQAIRMAGKRLFHFHACANDRGTPGNDNFDWQSIARALRDIQYDRYAVIESFCIDIKEIARSVSLWRPVADSPDTLAREGLAFLRRTLNES